MTRSAGNVSLGTMLVVIVKLFVQSLRVLNWLVTTTSCMIASPLLLTPVIKAGRAVGYGFNLAASRSEQYTVEQL